jgi:hypothetical protein
LYAFGASGRYFGPSRESLLMKSRTAASASFDTRVLSVRM